MKRLWKTEGLAWPGTQLRESVEPLLSRPWILDINVTIKPRYGHQQGASLGYNPHMPGRPSDAYHSYCMADTRLCLGAEVHGGTQHAAGYGLNGLWSLLAAPPRTQWPALLRGDCGYSSERLLAECETRGLPGLFKLRRSPKVKTLLTQMQRSGAQWQKAGDGWEVIEVQLHLSGWSRSRCVVLVREPPATAPVGDNAHHRRDTLGPFLPTAGAVGWTHRGVGSNAGSRRLSRHGPSAVVPRTRRRGKNNYDELKNQWDWCGYHTRLLGPRRLIANNVVELHLYARLYDDQHHRETITSQPAPLHGVGRLTRKGRSTRSKSTSNTSKATACGRRSHGSATTCIGSTRLRSNRTPPNAGRCR